MSLRYSFAVAAALISSLYANAGDVPFTRAGVASLPGKNICNLRGEFPVGVAVDLDLRKEYAVDYRERDGVYALFLLSNPSEHCGIVNAVLDLTPIIKKGESAEFKCYTNHEGGTTASKWGHVIGLANNQGGRKRFAKARLAWKVNLKDNQFEEIHHQVVH